MKLVMLLFGTTVVLSVLASNSRTIDRALGQKCNPVCIPAPEGEPAEEPLPRPVKPKPTHSILVINVGWGGASNAGAPLEEGALDRYVSYLRGPFNEWFAQSAPAGAFQSWTVTAGGRYTISPPPLPADPSHCNVTDKDTVFKSVADSAEAKARAQGINPDAYTVVVVGWSNSVCGFGGKQSGRRIGIVYPNQAMHEFGHYYGLQNHANARRCKDAGGNPVPLSANCSETEYADHYDSMGSLSAYSYGAIYTNQLGWLNGQYFDVTAGTAAQSFTLKAFTDPAHTQRAIRLQDGPATLWLEYRAPVGIDGPAFTGAPRYLVEAGLVVHRESSYGGLPQSQLLDMTPGSELGFDDAPLPIGSSWADPLGEAKVTLNGIGPGGATVTIAPQRIAVPDVRGYTLERAAATIAAAGLTADGLSAALDPSCTLIGLAVGSNPPAGTRLPPGSAVGLVVGERDPVHACL